MNRGQPDERELSKIDQLPGKAGDQVTFLMPGGGGYGDPRRRDPAALADDIAEGFVSEAAAERDYGKGTVRH